MTGRKSPERGQLAPGEAPAVHSAPSGDLAAYLLDRYHSLPADAQRVLAHLCRHGAVRSKEELAQASHVRRDELDEHLLRLDALGFVRVGHGRAGRRQPCACEPTRLGTAVYRAASPATSVSGPAPGA